MGGQGLESQHLTSLSLSLIHKMESNANIIRFTEKTDKKLNLVSGGEHIPDSHSKGSVGDDFGCPFPVDTLG